MTLKKFKSFIIPLVLVLGYLVLISYPYLFSKINRFDSLGLLSLIEEKHDKIDKTGKAGEHLLAREKITAKLISSENNLGIVLVKFSQLSPIVTDRVVFRIKEYGDEKWHYENAYNANQFHSSNYFTFGFPMIEDSKNKAYVFEVESLSGTGKNGIGLSSEKPQVAFAHKLTKKDLLNISILTKKLIYIKDSVNIWQNLQILAYALFFYFFIYFVRKEKINFTKKKKARISNIAGFLLFLKHIKSKNLLRLKPIIKFSKKITRAFLSTSFYSVFLNTNIKKRILIALTIFLLAFLYRFAGTSPDQLGIASYYAGLGGGGDYDQFIRAATCALDFCSWILHQNLLIESTVLGIFYEIFGFVGGLKAYLYLMIVLSSIVATLPYIILSRKNLITIGGIVGSLFLASSDYFVHMSLNLPPDNGSLFLFSMFYIVYLLTLQHGTIRWLLFLGLMGAVDGLNKLTFLLNDMAALALFVPVFLIEKGAKIKKFPFVKLNLKLLFSSALPLLVFLLIYWGWEYIVFLKFHAPYYLRGLIENLGSDYSYSKAIEGNAMMSTPQFAETFFRGGLLEKLYYYAGSAIVVSKRLIDNAGFNAVILIPLFISLILPAIRKSRFFSKEIISLVSFLSLLFVAMALFRLNFLGIQEIGQYVHAWSNDFYINIFTFLSIIFLFLALFKYRAIKLAIPILPYVVMLIVLAKSAPWMRMLAHVIVWSVILFSFLSDWILDNVNKKILLKRFSIGPIILVLFILSYTIPKTSDMAIKLWEGYNNRREEIEYLRWANAELPEEAIMIIGGKSDLITVVENIDRPVIYNSLWSAALLIQPGDIPGVAPEDFSIAEELKNSDNFKKNKYLILEDDIYLWRSRVAGVGDNLFSTSPDAILNSNNYSIKVYKFNPALNKGIYELELKEAENL